MSKWSVQICSEEGVAKELVEEGVVKELVEEGVVKELVEEGVAKALVGLKSVTILFRC
ncbi:MAG: hypothetical protein IKW15_07425 [Bacteroidales bacterium]|nr:hypothetical protein [Bacteroidales bacterium]